MPSRKPTSPTRVTMNAFTAAAGASGSLRSWPISRYEQMPMTSQPTSSRIEVAGDDDQQHGRGEEADLGGVRRVAVVVVQVGHRVDLHGQRDHADRDRDERGRAVDPYAERDRQVAEPHPLDDVSNGWS